MRPRTVLASLLLLSPAAALEIDIRYDYDTAGFFNQAGAREAMEAVAEFFEQRIHDSLAEINPGTFPGSPTWNASFFHPATGNLTSITDLVVPADTLIVFVGARNLGGATGAAGPGAFSYALGSRAWYDRIRYRGESGASATPATDFGPWGGSISFDNATTTWSFQLDGRPQGFQADFISSAMHELGHVLGIGSANSWDDRIVSGNFTGARAVNSFGAVIPVDSNAGHWKDDGCGPNPGPFAANSLTHNAFGTAHGSDQVALMDPVRCINYATTSLPVFTDLDFAGLVDIGWEIIPPQSLDPATVNPAAASFSWPTSTWLDYRLARSGNLSTWTIIYGPTPGNGETATWQDPSPPLIRAYYRLQTTIASAPAPLAPTPSPVRATTGHDIILPPISLPPRMVEGCGRHRH